MEVKKAIKKLEGSEEFKEFIKENPHYELAHAFTMINSVQGPWQIGYYSKEKDKVVVFEVDKKITRGEEEEVFKEPGKKVNGLDLEEVDITLEKAIDIANKTCKKKYPAEKVNKTIAILQTLKKAVFNITLTTASFNMINMRINAQTGKVENINIQSILTLGKNDI